MDNGVMTWQSEDKVCKYRIKRFIKRVGKIIPEGNNPSGVELNEIVETLLEALLSLLFGDKNVRVVRIMELIALRREKWNTFRTSWDTFLTQKERDDYPNFMFQLERQVIPENRILEEQIGKEIHELIYTSAIKDLIPPWNALVHQIEEQQKTAQRKVWSEWWEDMNTTVNLDELVRYGHNMLYGIVEDVHENDRESWNQWVTENSVESFLPKANVKLLDTQSQVKWDIVRNVPVVTWETPLAKSAAAAAAAGRESLHASKHKAGILDHLWAAMPTFSLGTILSTGSQIGLLFNCILPQFHILSGPHSSVGDFPLIQGLISVQTSLMTSENQSLLSMMRWVTVTNGLISMFNSQIAGLLSRATDHVYSYLDREPVQYKREGLLRFVKAKLRKERVKAYVHIGFTSATTLVNLFCIWKLSSLPVPTIPTPVVYACPKDNPGCTLSTPEATMWVQDGWAMVSHFQFGAMGAAAVGFGIRVMAVKVMENIVIPDVLGGELASGLIRMVGFSMLTLLLTRRNTPSRTHVTNNNGQFSFSFPMCVANDVAPIVNVPLGTCITGAQVVTPEYKPAWPAMFTRASDVKLYYDPKSPGFAFSDFSGFVALGRLGWQLCGAFLQASAVKLLTLADLAATAEVGSVVTELKQSRLTIDTIQDGLQILPNGVVTDNLFVGYMNQWFADILLNIYLTSKAVSKFVAGSVDDREVERVASAIFVPHAFERGSHRGRARLSEKIDMNRLLVLLESEKKTCSVLYHAIQEFHRLSEKPVGGADSEAYQRLNGILIQLGENIKSTVSDIVTTPKMEETKEETTTPYVFEEQRSVKPEEKGLEPFSTFTPGFPGFKDDSPSKPIEQPSFVHAPKPEPIPHSQPTPRLVPSPSMPKLEPLTPRPIIPSPTTLSTSPPSSSLSLLPPIPEERTLTWKEIKAQTATTIAQIKTQRQPTLSSLLPGQPPRGGREVEPESVYGIRHESMYDTQYWETLHEPMHDTRHETLREPAHAMDMRHTVSSHPKERLEQLLQNRDDRSLRVDKIPDRIHIWQVLNKKAFDKHSEDEREALISLLYLFQDMHFIDAHGYEWLACDWVRICNLLVFPATDVLFFSYQVRLADFLSVTINDNHQRRALGTLRRCVSRLAPDPLVMQSLSQLIEPFLQTQDERNAWTIMTAWSYRWQKLQTRKLQWEDVQRVIQDDFYGLLRTTTARMFPLLS